MMLADMMTQEAMHTVYLSISSGSMRHLAVPVYNANLERVGGEMNRECFIAVFMAATIASEYLNVAIKLLINVLKWTHRFLCEQEVGNESSEAKTHNHEDHCRKRRALILVVVLACE